MNRRQSKTIQIGNRKIGGNEPIAIQSMANTDTHNVEATVKQILKLEKYGCEIVRIGIPDMEAAKCVGEIEKRINIPLVADIHFDYRLALESIRQGTDKIRINPGNIGLNSDLLEILQAAKDKNIPIRIGVNSGSIEKEILAKYGEPCPEAMVESVMKYVDWFEKNDFENLVLSLKSSNVLETIECNKLIASRTNYPLHLGVTEAGTLKKGTIRSAVALGTLLEKGIGDTIRVSLSADPVEEIKVAKEILSSLDLKQTGVRIVSCPTCSRTKVDVIGIAQKLEDELESFQGNMKIAVMGCEVNGPGEAKEADWGIVGGVKFGTIYKKGEIVKQLPKNELSDYLLKEILNK